LVQRTLCVTARYHQTMECPKCKTANSETERFCKRCHFTLLFNCPACKSSQRHGGKCDKCGVDLAKYAMALASQEQTRAVQSRERKREHAGMWKQILLLPITGGFSLIRYFLRRT
jgi:hypothetical protein